MLALTAVRKGMITFSRAILSAALLFCWVGCDGSGTGAPDEEPPVGTVREIMLSSYADSVLSIGRDPILEYPYDARGPGSPGTMTYLGSGRANILFKAEDMEVKHLYPFGENFPVYVKILPTDMIGMVNFCSQRVEIDFDSLFQPVVFGIERQPMSVVSQMTTGVASGDFRQVTGRPLDERGDLLLVSVAVVPPTGDPAVDDVLDLPTDAVSEIESHFDFPQDPFSCPGSPSTGIADTMHMAVGKDGLLSIAFLGSFAEFPYDGKGSDGMGRIGPVRNGIAQVVFGDFVVPDLQFIPGLDAIRIEITPHSLTGEVDFCCGRVDLDFDATFTPVMGETQMTSISVATTITTETSIGFSQSRTGERLDRWGDATLVGVAKVPLTEDPFINFMLSLPNDAVCELPVHLDFLGGSRPACS